MPTSTPQAPVGTGYADAYGNVWLFARDGRRMLAPGERYITTHGEIRTVPGRA